jgi:hypothetical protein
VLNAVDHEGWLKSSDPTFMFGLLFSCHVNVAIVVAAGRLTGHVSASCPGSNDVTDATRFAGECGIRLHELEDLVVGDVEVVLLRGLLDEVGLHAELGPVVDDVDAVVFEG